MNEEVEEQMNIMCDMAIKVAPKFAKIYKTLFDCLIKEGFTKQEAMIILASYKVGK